MAYGTRGPNYFLKLSIACVRSIQLDVMYIRDCSAFGGLVHTTRCGETMKKCILAALSCHLSSSRPR
ncbi:hypothetical protein M3J09_001968 [Ascochyta lentis]